MTGDSGVDLIRRVRAIETLAGQLMRLRHSHPVRVGVDGVSAAGKTILADELAASLESQGRHVVRASLDGFHHPEEIRYQQGRDCPIGYYEDSFDYDSVQRNLLEPLGPEGDLQYRPAAFDYRSGEAVQPGLQKAPSDAILIFEGVMLFRPELDSGWDYRILVHVDPEVSLARALVRDREHFGSEEDVRRKHALRFGPGQGHYLEQQRPQEKADAVLDNSQFDQPHLRFKD